MNAQSREETGSRALKVAELRARHNGRPAAPQEPIVSQLAARNARRASAEAKEEARERLQMLLELRKERAEQVLKSREILRNQLAVRRTLKSALQDGPRSVPQLAEATGMARDEVLWHMAAMKKYGLVEEAGTDDEDEYYLYGLPKGAKL